MVGRPGAGNSGSGLFFSLPMALFEEWVSLSLPLSRRVLLVLIVLIIINSTIQVALFDRSVFRRKKRTGLLNPH